MNKAFIVVISLLIGFVVGYKVAEIKKAKDIQVEKAPFWVISSNDDQVEEATIGVISSNDDQDDSYTITAETASETHRKASSANTQTKHKTTTPQRPAEQSTAVEANTPQQTASNRPALTVINFEQGCLDHQATVTIRNNTDKTITHFSGTIIYKNMAGEVIDYEEIDQRLEIAPHMAKPFKIKGYGHDLNYAYYKSETYDQQHRFKYEFQLKGYATK